jgi:alpha-1,6-mannosyltransferase
MQNPSPASTLLPTLGLAALAFGLGALFNSLGRWQKPQAQILEFITLALAGGILYLAAVFLVERYRLDSAGLLIILLGAVTFRLAVLPSLPFLFADVYRYQWEGRVQRLNLNPYTVTPSTPGLRELQDPRHPLETGRTISTVYPPLSEWSFTWARTWHGYKQLYTGLDLAAVFLLLAILGALRQPLHRVLTYAWNPGVIVSFAMCGHHDSLAIATLLAAILLIVYRKPALSVSFLALSVLSKFFSLLLLPLILKRTRAAYVGLFAAVIAAAYLPYLSAGRQLFAGLSNYAVGWEGNDSLFRLIRAAGNSKAQAELVVLIFVLALVAHTLKSRLEPVRAVLFLFAGLLFLSPNAFPWYFTWIVPFLCFYPRAPLLLVSVSCALGYAPVIAYAAGQPYRDSPFILALEYAPVFVWLGIEGCHAVRNPRPEIHTS